MFWFLFLSFTSTGINLLVFIYLFVGATDWCKRWKKNGWKTVNGTEVKNKVEFQILTKLCDEIDVKWVCFIDLKKVYYR